MSDANVFDLFDVLLRGRIDARARSVAQVMHQQELGPDISDLKAAQVLAVDGRPVQRKDARSCPT